MAASDRSIVSSCGIRSKNCYRSPVTPKASQFSKFADVLETRIRRGDYAIRELPTEHELASEIGASRTTARWILQQLVTKGVVKRKPHGRLEINHRHERLRNRLQIAFLAPAFPSRNYALWHYALNQLASRHRAMIRAVEYVHWDDPIILETLNGFDGVFLFLSSDPVPALMMDRFRRASHLVILEENLSDRGLLSLQALPPFFIHRLCDHLYQLGHRRIDCLNTQPPGKLIQDRIDQWLLWCRAHQVPGRLIDEPVQSYVDPVPQAYKVIQRLLAAGDLNSTALLCITNDAASGAIRAIHERGLQTGKDISVCAVDGANAQRYSIPSRTVLVPPDPAPYLSACLDWMSKRTERWSGPLLIQPSDVTLYVGESTGPCPAVSPAASALPPKSNSSAP